MAKNNPTIKVEEDPELGTGPVTEGETSNPSQTTEGIQSYIDSPLAGLIKMTKSEETVACIDYKGKINVQEYKLCLLLKSKRVHQEYFGVKNTVATIFLNQVEQVENKVKAYITKTEDIQKALNSSLDAIKESKKKLWAIRESACKLDAARNDSCNSEQLSAMKGIPVGEPDGTGGIARFHALVDNIIEASNELYDTVDDTFEDGVRVAGILAYMNMIGLEEFSSKLKVNAGLLDTDVTGNLTYVEEQIASAQKKYTEGLQLLDKSLFANNTTHLSHLSLEAFKTYADTIKSKSCEEERLLNLEQIDQLIKQVMQEDINCS